MAELQRSVRNGQRVVVGVTGVPGSGKSVLSTAAALRVGANCAVLQMDGYHFTRRQLDTFPDPIDAHARRGAPFTFDAATFAQVVADIRAGRHINALMFDHAVKDPTPGRLIDDSITAVIVEGNYLLLESVHWSCARESMHQVWYIDIPINVAMRRVLHRLILDVGFDEMQARSRIANNDAANARVVRQSMRRADFIIDQYARVERVEGQQCAQLHDNTSVDDHDKYRT